MTARTPKPSSDPDQARLERLRAWRTFPAPDQSLSFLKSQFKREVEKPYKQLQQIIELWRGLVPPDLEPHTRLESLVRGVLRVAVDSSSHCYELDRLLRQGLEKQLITSHKGPALRRIRLHVAPAPNP